MADRTCGCGHNIFCALCEGSGRLSPAKAALADVLAERDRQRRKWGDKHDDEHTNDSLAYGAVDFLLPGQQPMQGGWAYASKVLKSEPRRTQLVKGVALALAALEQYDRAHGARERSRPEPGSNPDPSPESSPPEPA